jgi:hypothetical protein
VIPLRYFIAASSEKIIPTPRKRNIPIKRKGRLMEKVGFISRVDRQYIEYMEYTDVMWKSRKSD